MKRLTPALLLSLLCLAAAPATQPVPRPPMVSAQEWGSTPQPIPDERRHTPKYITIHHAGVVWKPGGDPAKFVKNMQGWGQRDKRWPDLPYHFLIAPDGRIFEGRSLAYEPESNTKYMLQGHVGVELMGHFGEQRMTGAQLKSLVSLAAWLSQSLNIPPTEIAGHKDRAQGQTACPGADLDRYIQDGQIRAWVAEALEGKQPDVKLRDPLPDGPTVLVGEPLPTTAPRE